jgi:hypothetical protein
LFGVFDYPRILLSEKEIFARATILAFKLARAAPQLKQLIYHFIFARIRGAQPSCIAIVLCVVTKMIET